MVDSLAQISYFILWCFLSINPILYLNRLLVLPFFQLNYLDSYDKLYFLLNQAAVYLNQGTS